ncbi:MAG TPA: BREX-1 system phosphatase PglZ type A [Nitrospirae bacterium]|nr:BREX-1 system phosphatase PglZ type A [Nitrospirota bacterium]
MNAAQLTDSLTGLFKKDGHRLVFWYDAERKFDKSIDSLKIDDVRIIRLDEVGALELKIMLELEDTKNPYLVYAPFAEPERKDDWLLDIKLYSRTFHADPSSILLDELGLNHQSLRAYLKQRHAFLGNQDRVNRLKKWVRPEDMESEIDTKMIAVLARAEQPDIFYILIKLFSELCQQEKLTLIQDLKAWDEIEKYGLSGHFWELVVHNFGYKENEPSLYNLLIRILVTDFALEIKGDLPQSLNHFLLPKGVLASNASVFLSQWRGSVQHHESYNQLSRKISQELKISEHIDSMDESQLINVMTFEAVERRVAGCLRDIALSSSGFDIRYLKELISARVSGYWASPLLRDEETGKYYLMIYSAIEAAAELLALKKQYSAGITYATADEMYSAYTAELYKFDQYYRLFHEFSDLVELKGGDILKKLGEEVENCYCGWFIDRISVAWGNFVDTDKGGILHHWSLQDVVNQQDFYEKHVESALKNAPQSKVYVVISDAFRFEAAEELTREINSKNRFQAELTNMLGVLPSYTSLGMSSLLPHKKISYKPKSSDVLVDDLPTASFDQRSKILSQCNGVAVKSDALMAMKRDEGREFVKPWQVIYVYHNQIDAIGDKAATESKAFDAVRTTIKELNAIVGNIINNLNGSQVFVTSDHGFMYQEKAPGTQEKTGLDKKPEDAIESKKRYIIGDAIGKDTKVWSGKVSETAGIYGDTEFWIPKGTNLFHFAGGARFIHGGAMLQEIVIPLIQVKQLRGKSAEKSAVRKVEISPLGTIRKIVNNVQVFEFIQTEAVTERVQERTLTVSLRDASELISNEVKIKFDSQSSLMDERKKAAKIMVKAGQYDKKCEYALVLRDAETEIEYMRIPLIIDLAFTSEF